MSSVNVNSCIDFSAQIVLVRAMHLWKSCAGIFKVILLRSFLSNGSFQLNSVSEVWQTLQISEMDPTSWTAVNSKTDQERKRCFIAPRFDLIITVFGTVRKKNVRDIDRICRVPWLASHRWVFCFSAENRMTTRERIHLIHSCYEKQNFTGNKRESGQEQHSRMQQILLFRSENA